VSRSTVVSFWVLALLTLGEIRLFDRLLFEGRDDAAFVLANVQGILDGRPVSKSWQHRLLAPHAVAALTPLAGDRRQALRVFNGVMVVAANLLLFTLLRRRGGASPERTLAVVATFGFAHALAMYKLEYPWDGIDVLLFLAFGAWAAKGGGLLRFVPLLLVGMLNHETILYVPLWYMLAPLDRKSAKREIAEGVVALVILGGGILLLRERLYVGRPDWPGQVFEEALPLVGNHFHIGHNAGQLFCDDWIQGRAFISGTFLSAVVVLVERARKGRDVRAAVWTLIVLGTIVCFGYVNETRHYLALIAFWFTYAAGVRADEKLSEAARDPGRATGGNAHSPTR
jgi:hypothetical protein